MGSYDLETRMANARLEELLEIANSSPEDGFEPAFVAAAQSEIEQRELNQETLLDARRYQTAYAATNRDRAEIPMKNIGWIFFAVFGVFFIVSIPGALILRSQGYNQMSKDAVSGIFASLFLWVIVFPSVIFAIDWLTS